MRVPVLCSYAYLLEWEQERLAPVLQHPNVEWLIDSGGFSALNAGKELSLDDYCTWLLQWQSNLHGYVALDVVGNPKKTDDNLRVMKDAGLSPLPVHVWGDDERRMDELFEMSQWVALGGLRRPHRLHAPKSYVKQKHMWAKGRNVHWLGYTHGGMLRALRPYSCDSSNNSGGYRFGSMLVYHGDCRTWTTPSARVQDKRSWRFTPAEERWLARCGYHANDLMQRENRRTAQGVNIPGEVTMNSFIRYALDMQKVYGVRPYLAVVPTLLPVLLRLIEQEVARQAA